MEPIYKNPDTNNKNIHVKVSPNNKWYFLITLRDERSNGEKIENNDSQKKRKYK
jgi:hypothetical protein